MDLKSFRRKQGLSQEKMAQVIGTSLSMYAKVESGYVDASRGFMQKLKKQYPSVSIDELFFRKEEQQ